MAVFVSDTFTEASNTSLTSHTGETGSSWTQHTITPSGSCEVNGTLDTVYTNYAGNSVIYATGTPGSADYTIEFDITIVSKIGNFGAAARIDTAANTMYFMRYNNSGSSWELYEMLAGSATLLDSFSQSLTLSQTYAVKFVCTDAAKEVYIDTVLRMSDATNDITAAGKVGFRGLGVSTQTTGMHIDNFVATDESTGGILLPASNHIVRLMN